MAPSESTLEYPTGTLTFLFTDLEGSTRLWEQHPESMKAALARHDALLRATVIENRGLVVKTTGDGLHAVFVSASDATLAALQAQHGLADEEWPSDLGEVRVRMGLHTGESQLREGDYYGTTVNRSARIMSIGYGGQVLLSGTTVKLIQNSLPPDCSLLDLGEHTLKDLSRPGNIFQLCHPDLQVEFPPLRSLAAYRHNLPAQLTSFVGREAELIHIHEQLPETRLLTMVGPGGTGKTRLMLQAAAELIDDYKHGVWLLELAPLADPERLWDHLAAVFQVQEQPGRAFSDTLVDFLRPKEALLLIDNVEHLVAEVAVMVERLVTASPGLRILVTSREALNIGGETVLSIPPLPVPEDPDLLSYEQARSATAVRLFIERAQAANPDFELSDENALAVAEITRRLDGIPLAIELAAARTTMLPVEQIVVRLEDRFRLLTGGRRTALPRQQTLKALIDWSWNLLNEDEQVLFRRLSIFGGGWTLDAAEAVAAEASLDVLENLSQLVNKSLVIVENLATGGVRYRMLESIQEYARERLIESGEWEHLEEQHAHYHREFAERTAEKLRSPDMVPWLRRIRLEVDNIRKMLAWLLENNPDGALALTAHLFHSRVYWISPGEARAWLEAALEKYIHLDSDGFPLEYGAAQIGLGLQLHNQGDYPGSAAVIREGLARVRQHGAALWIARGLNAAVLANAAETPVETVQMVDEAIGISREHDFKIELAVALGIKAFAKIMAGDLESSQVYAEEAITLAQEYGNLWLTAGLLRLRGNMLKPTGALGEAREYYMEALAKMETVGDRHLINAIRSDLADLHRLSGDIEEAEALYQDTILGWQELGHKPMLAHQLECFAYIAIAEEDYLRAAELIGAAQSLRAGMESETRLVPEIAEFEEAMDRLKDAVGETELAARIEMGSRLSLDEAISYVLSGK